MSGKDLLELLAMFCPTLILIAIAFAQGLSGTGKVDVPRDASTRAEAQHAAQKRMHDPWAVRDHTKSASVSTDEYCDEGLSGGKFSCYYW